MPLRSLFLSLAGLFAASAVAQQRDERTLLWRISGNGLKQPSYLYGTMHVSSRIAYHLTDSFFVALDRCQVVAMELDPGTWLNDMLTSDLYRLAQGIEGPSGPRGDLYEGLFSLDALDRQSLRAACTRRPDLVDHLMYRNEDADSDYSEGTFLDLFFYQAGRKLGKQIMGLERMDEVVSLNLLAEMADEDEEDDVLDEQRKLKLEKLRKEGRSLWELMEEAYRQNDLQRIDTLFDLQHSPRYRHYFIDERNRNMVDAMEPVMRGKPVFAGVGAMHLPGAQGMIGILRERGYRLDPVVSKVNQRSINRKQRIDDTYLPPALRTWWSSDSLLTMDLPGAAYDVPRSLDPWLGTLCTDQVNGTFAAVSRIPTGADVLGRDAGRIMARIDSALLEVIPGRTVSRSEITDPSGLPAYRITSVTSQGQRMNYRILVAPSEVIVVRSVCKDDPRIVRDTERSLASFRYVRRIQGGAPVLRELPGCRVELPARAAVRIARPTLALSAGAVPFDHIDARGQDEQGHLYLLRSAVYNDLNYIEGDTFELGRLRDVLAERMGTTALTWDVRSATDLPSVSAAFVRAPGDTLRGLWLLRGTHYYQLLTSAPEVRAQRFFASFALRGSDMDAPAERFEDPVVAYRTTAPNLAATFGEAFVKVKKAAHSRPVKKDTSEPYTTERYSDVLVSANAPEAVRVELLVHHLYFSTKDMDTYWDMRVGDLEERTGAVARGRRTLEHRGLPALDVLLCDSTSRRALQVRMVLKQGARHTLITAIDTVLGPSPWQQLVFASFEPADTSFRAPVMDSKVALYLGDRANPEKKIKERAKSSLSVIIFRESDGNLLMDYISGADGRKEEMKERSNMIRELGPVKHADVLSFLERTYLQAGDTAQLQLAALRTLARQRSKASADLFARLIYVETPLVKDESEMRNVFAPWFDSLPVAAVLFPRVLDLARFPEYRTVVYNLLAACVQSGNVDPYTYDGERPILVTEATIELKRALSLNKRSTGTNESNLSEGASLPFVPRRAQSRLMERTVNKEPGPDNDLLQPGSPLVMSFARILLPFHASDPAVAAWFDKVLRSGNDRLVVETAALLQRAGRPVDPAIWARCQKQDNTRYWTQKRLTFIGASALLDSSASDTLSVARAFLFANRYLEDGDSIRFIEQRRVSTKLGDTHLFFFGLKTKDSKKDEWRQGMCGLITGKGGTLLDAPAFFNWDYGQQPLGVLKMRLDDKVKAVRAIGRKRWRQREGRYD